MLHATPSEADHIEADKSLESPRPSKAVQSSSSSGSQDEVDNNGDGLLRRHMNSFFQFKDTNMYLDYLQFNRTRNSSFTTFLFVLLLTLITIPYGIWLLWMFATPQVHSDTNDYPMFVLILVNLLLFWLVYYLQLGKLQKVPENHVLRVLLPYSMQIQTTLYFLVMVYCCLRLFTRVFKGHCPSKNLYEEWDCNPMAKSHSLPLESLLLVLTMPFILVLMLKEVRFVASLIAIAAGIVCIFIAASHVDNAIEFVPLIVIYIMISWIVYYDLQRQNYIVFLTNHKLRDTLAENERMADEMHANEMRSMIANVAHDLKTPLSSFLSGIEYIGQVVLDLKNLTEKKQQLCANDVEDFIVSITNCIGNIKSTNAFMLMAINRCLDYTKASKGMKLVPKYETINLQEALTMPLNCMKDIQSRVSIKLHKIPTEICSHVITDKQWLQENILCLLSNAVKYSSEGEVTITIALRKVTAKDQDLYEKMNRMLIGKQQISGSLPEEPITSSTSYQYSEHMQQDVDNENIDHRLSFTQSGRNTAPDGYIIIEIEDHGIGIPEQDMASLFSPFKQAQRLVGGTGLGLYSLMKRVEALHSTCGVRGRRDGQKGTLFWFEIPYRPDRLYATLQNNRKLGIKIINTSFGLIGSTGSTSITVPEVGRYKTSNNSSPEKLPVTEESASNSFHGNLSHAFNGNIILSMENTTMPLARQSFTSNDINTEDTTLASTMKTAEELRQSLQLNVAPPPLNILLVEDTLSILKMTSMMLKRHGHSVVCAENGEIALKCISEQLQKYTVPFDVILMDLQMPVMDGLEAGKRLRAMETAGDIIATTDSFIRTPEESPVYSHEGEKSGTSPPPNASSANKKRIKHVIIGVSANSDHDTRESAYHVGFDAFIAKPFSVDTFYDTIEMVRNRTKQERPQR